MLDFIVDAWDSLITFMQMWPYYLMNLDEFYDDYIEFLLKHVVDMTFWFTERSMVASYEITKEFLDSFNYKENIQAAWNSIPETPRAILSFFRLPECLNIIVSAFGTKFVMKFVPFAGR